MNVKERRRRRTPPCPTTGQFSIAAWRACYGKRRGRQQICTESMWKRWKKLFRKAFRLAMKDKWFWCYWMTKGRFLLNKIRRTEFRECDIDLSSGAIEGALSDEVAAWVIETLETLPTWRRSKQCK
jgi:hypothetical protein